MAKNKLSDLNDHLFATLERLNEEDLSADQIEIESKRAEAIIGVSNQIINNAKITIDALKLVTVGNLTFNELPDSFGLKRINQ
ncbi:hypothetical protein JGH11_19200 [Dysgonomonas sp. Marseille-P4677]|uniref:hypothetical protein n=1 Tax=Dysgonomonas sp. Marseille-P4677 TaxID=2364790 RepID=UPI001913564F|nr:hypothetical protein [Dysgonomonas sp. Marseille-P4677]MBK5722999.1 hypothetical protein [Dysgonomonas sp. Marseille-P4677]